jgi:hypothetical protein
MSRSCPPSPQSSSSEGRGGTGWSYFLGDKIGLGYLPTQKTTPVCGRFCLQKLTEGRCSGEGRRFGLGRLILGRRRPNPSCLPLRKGGVTSPFVIFFLSKTGKRGIERDFHCSMMTHMSREIHFTDCLPNILVLRPWKKKDHYYCYYTPSVKNGMCHI